MPQHFIFMDQDGFCFMLAPREIAMVACRLSEGRPPSLHHFCVPMRLRDFEEQIIGGMPVVRIGVALDPGYVPLLHRLARYAAEDEPMEPAAHAVC